MAFKYSVNLFWSDEDDCYVATIPEFPGLSAFGESPEEAVGEAKLAAEGFIQIMKEDGEKVPEPKKLQTYSGQIRLRMPKNLHSELTMEAERQDVSLNTYIITLLAGKNMINRIEGKFERFAKQFSEIKSLTNQKARPESGVVPTITASLPRPTIGSC